MPVEIFFNPAPVVGLQSEKQTVQLEEKQVSSTAAVLCAVV